MPAALGYFKVFVFALGHLQPSVAKNPGDLVDRYLLAVVDVIDLETLDLIETVVVSIETDETEAPVDSAEIAAAVEISAVIGTVILAAIVVLVTSAVNVIAVLQTDLVIVALIRHVILNVLRHVVLICATGLCSLSSIKF